MLQILLSTAATGHSAPETAAAAGQSLRLLSRLLSSLLSANHPKSLHRRVRRPSQAFYPHQGTLLTPSDSCRAEDPLASSDGQMAASKSGPAYDGGDDGTLLSEKSDRDDPDVPVAEATAVDRRQTFLETCCWLHPSLSLSCCFVPVFVTIHVGAVHSSTSRQTCLLGSDGCCRKRGVLWCQEHVCGGKNHLHFGPCEILNYMQD